MLFRCNYDPPGHFRRTILFPAAARRQLRQSLEIWGSEDGVAHERRARHSNRVGRDDSSGSRTVGKIAVMHTKPPFKGWCEAFAFAPPLFEGVNICLRDLGFAAAKATTLSGRIDSAASIIVVMSPIMKLLPPAETLWKTLIEERVVQVFTVEVHAPFDQFVPVLAFVLLDCSRFHRPTPGPLAPAMPAPSLAPNVVAPVTNTLAAAHLLKALQSENRALTKDRRCPVFRLLGPGASEHLMIAFHPRPPLRGWVLW